MLEYRSIDWKTIVWNAWQHYDINPKVDTSIDVVILVYVCVSFYVN